jgi:hypothetical protein
MASMPYMPPGAVEEALARMRGESEDTSDAARAMRTGYVPPRQPDGSQMPRQPQGAPAPMGPQQVAMPGPAQMFHALRGRLIQRGMAPTDAARAAAAALRRRTGTMPMPRR